MEEVTYKSYYMVNPKFDVLTTPKYMLDDMVRNHYLTIKKRWDINQYYSSFARYKSVLICVSGSHRNNITHFLGVADSTEPGKWILKEVVSDGLEEFQNYVRQNPKLFLGGCSGNPWQNRHIISIEDEEAIKIIDKIRELHNYDLRYIN